MKKLLEIALGIMTSVGGFLDAGAIATALEAGSRYGYSLIWAFALATVCVMFLVEMSGRLAAVSGHTLIAAVRERFGFKFFALPLGTEILVDLLVLASEIGGVCFALQLVTGIGFQWWAPVVAALLCLALWRGTFGAIEKTTATLGLVALVFVYAAWALRPDGHEIARALIPAVPKGAQDDLAHYLYTAVAIIGAVISPYLFYFYSSGAIEDGWKKDHIGVNRAVAGVGMGFGSAVALGLLITACLVLRPAGVKIETFADAKGILDPVLGGAGVYLFAAVLGIACLGAAFEVSLNLGYVASQAFGWNWGESKKPCEAARFAFVYTSAIVIATIPVLIGFDPLKLTMFAMALTALILPIVVVPFLILMNDRSYVGAYRNGLIGNTVMVFTLAVTFVLALVTIPLQILGA